jgi:RNA polymerase-binding transcription factor DksA
MQRSCSSCGEEVSKKRIEAKPSATLCISCQHKVEADAPKEEEPIAYFRREQVLFGNGSND